MRAGTNRVSKRDEFDPVAEDVLNMTAFDSGYLVIFADGNTSGPELHDQATIVRAGKRGMRFLRRAEIFFDSEMNVDIATLQPEPPTSSKFRRLGNFFHAEQRAIELTRILFVALGHGELHVIQFYERN